MEVGMIKLNESMIINILNAHAPIKAVRICSMIRKDYGEIQKKDINSLLYKMASKGLTSKNDNYEWTVGQVPSRNSPKKVNNVGTNRVVNNPSANKVNDGIKPIVEKFNNDENFELSEEQEKVVGMKLDDNLLIRGQAGSGKTTVLAARAGRSLSITSKGSMLFLTYNAALSKYVAKMFKSKIISKEIKVLTYHDWAMKMAEAMGYKFGGWVPQRDRTAQLKEIISEVNVKKGPHRFYDHKDVDTVAWWNEEISWIFGQGIIDFEKYKHVERVGRGIAIRVPLVDREYVWHVYAQYLEWLKDEDKEDYDNVAGLVTKAMQQYGSTLPENLRYDHVFIDEVQDFDKSWLSVLAPIPRISLSMAGDIAQKIYKRSFTWKSVGIKIQAHRSVPLRGSFRTTKQIMNVAIKIIENCSMQSDEDYVNPIIPRKNGPLIHRLKRKGIKEAYNDGYQYAVKKFKRIRTSTVAIALPLSTVMKK